MNSDKSLQPGDEDKFNRGSFIGALAEEIIDIERQSSCVVGLYGSWGSGKSSILNLLKPKLEGKYYFVSEFSPWLLKTEEDMIRDLFKTILEGARNDKKLKANEKLNALGEKLVTYSELIHLPTISVAGVEIGFSKAAQGVTKIVGKELQADDTVLKAKKAVNDTLLDLAVPLVVFVDDIDRLTADEIQLLIKIIRVTADFDNLIYVLAFDERQVALSISTSVGGGTEDVKQGLAYLEKIVQLPLRLPMSTEEQRRDYTLEHIHAWWEKEEIAIDENRYTGFIHHFVTLHGHLIKTPRDSKRLANACAFTYRTLRREIDALDVVLLEMIRMNAPSLFDKLVELKGWLFTALPLVDVDSGTRAQVNRQDNRKRDSQLDAEAKEFGFRGQTEHDRSSEIQDIVSYLFPYNTVYTGAPWFNGTCESREELFQGQRVGFTKYFNRYLRMSVDEGDMSHEELQATVTNLNSSTLPGSQLWVKELEQLNRGQVLENLKHVKPVLSGDGHRNLILLLCSNPHFYTPTESNEWILRPNRNFALNLWREIEQLDPSKSEALAMSLTSSCNSPWQISEVFDHIEHEPTDSAKKNTPDYLRLKSIESAYYRELLKENKVNLFDNLHAYRNDVLFRRITKGGYEEVLRERVKAFVSEEPDNVFTYLKSFTPFNFRKKQTDGWGVSEVTDRIVGESLKYCEPSIMLEHIYERYPLLRGWIVPEEVPIGEYKGNERIARQVVIHLHFKEKRKVEATTTPGV